VRQLGYEAADCGLLSPDLAARIRRVKGVKKLGVRLGNWLTANQAETLRQAPDPVNLKVKRDRIESRLANRIQLTTDGHKMYLTAVEDAFGSGIDYAMLAKIYGRGLEANTRYSPATCIGAIPQTVTGNSDPKHVSTSTSNGRTST